MKKIAFSLLATSSLALFIGVSDVDASSYTIKPGDTLWKVASTNNVSVANIKKWNNLTSDTIRPNQSLKLTAPVPAKSSTSISKPSTSSPTASAANSYIVKSGDTLSRIATLHKTTVKDLQKLNGLSNFLIFPGQKLKVSGTATAPAASKTPAPAKTAAPVTAPAAPGGTYKVASGDTLTNIAHRHGISVTQIMNWNNLSSSLIRVGQVLKVNNSLVATQPKTTPVSKPTVMATGAAEKVVSTATSLIGIPYVWGGATTSGFDCSGFIYYVYNKAGINLPRTNTTGYDARSYDVSNPKVGDLVFFSNTYRAGISHMGIYLGDNKFIHAGGDRVQITSLSDKYWGKHFDGFKRLYAMD
ncbi:LysM peptidoglycan-binding domain-containing protein [Planococcus shenhongbingii]|uniref:C40 family peptidase n=1 Tax=Planococcus shenhongbingii TaxID=3058398 RepID=UPI00261E03C1|nr:peptidoglycan endopeptidase [Planococcus sp. N016]WKA58844.1 LysM peptidoglycan-binding domain-containing protein [Planococcus sp. N016]